MDGEVGRGCVISFHGWPMGCVLFVVLSALALALVLVVHVCIVRIVYLSMENIISRYVFYVRSREVGEK
jgi:hypothetical protein